MAEAVDTTPGAFDRDGAALFAGAATPILADLFEAVSDLPDERAGVRIGGSGALAPYLAPDGPIGAIAAGAIGNCRAVRAVLFDKTVATNWSLERFPSMLHHRHRPSGARCRVPPKYYFGGRPVAAGRFRPGAALLVGYDAMASRPPRALHQTENHLRAGDPT